MSRRQISCPTSYSGDTMPTDEFANWAQGADVLIHEATFADTEEDRSKATARRHSTISQALEVAKK
jgi:ribonuclease Z